MSLSCVLASRSFTQYCDLTRQFDPTPSPNTTNGLPNGTVVPAYKGPGVDTFILEFGRLDLIDYSMYFILPLFSILLSLRSV